MRKLICFVLMTVFLMANCLPVYADGIGDNQRSDYPGVTDYQKHPVSLNDDHKKPSAGFSLQIKTSFGSLRAETIKSGNIDGKPNIVPSQDSPVINAAVGDSIVISDRCTKGTGSIINQYDIQYRFVPEGSNREDCEIHSQIVSNFDAVKNIIEKLPLNEKGTYEIFMAVADNASCLPGAVNWSANGNFRTINTSNKNFPNGMFWYFTEALVKVGAGFPDFYPTPEGSTEWKEEYKDPNKGAKTYEYKQGQTEITFPVTLRNSGEKAVTDFRAVWYGKGSDSTAGWQGTNPAWKSDPAEIELDKNGEQTFNVTVPLPVPDGSKGLLCFKANVNGNTPATETNQENNLMFIQIKSKGVDIKVVQPTQPRVFKLKPGKSVTIDIPYVVVRVDESDIPVEVDVKATYPGGVDKDKPAFSNDYDSKSYNAHITLNKVGTYALKVTAWPVGVEDIDPSNNTGQTTIIIKADESYNAEKINSDNQTRVNLRS